MSDLMTVDEYARHRGCSTRAVRKAIDAGRIEAQRAGRRWLIDAAAADLAWFERTDVLRTHAAIEPAAAETLDPADPVDRAVREVVGQLLDMQIEIEPGKSPMLATGLVIPLVALAVDADADPDPLRRRIRIAIAETARQAVDLEAIKE